MVPNKIVFWRAAGCFKSACAILDLLEDPKKPLTLKDTNIPLFIRTLQGSKYSPSKGDVIINWGNGGFKTFPELFSTNYGIELLNHPLSVAKAADKRKTFEEFATDPSIQTVQSTTNKSKAKEWLDNGHTVIVRKEVDGCCGSGIVVCNPGDTLPNAPLYTKYRKKTDEFRVHVFNDKVIDVVQKRLKKGLTSNGIIRNVDDGWVFCHKNIVEPADLREQAVKAVTVLGLDFGAVDIVWNKHYNKSYVLEVNTAPGLELTETVQAYAKAILEWIANK